tara:strand:+ start:2008 stop:2286 length:279 start_codon:yes stop_codon:yes gene_type:complete
MSLNWLNICGKNKSSERKYLNKKHISWCKILVKVIYVPRLDELSLDEKKCKWYSKDNICDFGMEEIVRREFIGIKSKKIICDEEAILMEYIN